MIYDILAKQIAESRAQSAATKNSGAHPTDYSVPTTGIGRLPVTLPPFLLFLVDFLFPVFWFCVLVAVGFLFSTYFPFFLFL